MALQFAKLRFADAGDERQVVVGPPYLVEMPPPPVAQLNLLSSWLAR
jgi:hypothetical protein